MTQLNRTTVTKKINRHKAALNLKLFGLNGVCMFAER